MKKSSKLSKLVISESGHVNVFDDKGYPVKLSRNQIKLFTKYTDSGFVDSIRESFSRKDVFSDAFLVNDALHKATTTFFFNENTSI